jgi:hypothetical protein
MLAWHMNTNAQFEDDSEEVNVSLIPCSLLPHSPSEGAVLPCDL